MKIDLTKREILYQWDCDIFVKVTLEGDEKVDEIHFVNRLVRNDALAMMAKANENGDILVEVPKQLLVVPGKLYVYPIVYSENGEQTLGVETFTISAKEKNPDYIHSETEVLSYRKLSEELLQKMKKLEEEIAEKGNPTDEQVKDAVNAYLKENPIESGGSASKEQIKEVLTEALEEAKESGEFDGKDGEDGKEGYTPQKGKDYFTEEDKAEFVEDVLNALPTWQGGAY